MPTYNPAATQADHGPPPGPGYVWVNGVGWVRRNGSNQDSAPPPPPPTTIAPSGGPGATEAGGLRNEGQAPAAGTQGTSTFVSGGKIVPVDTFGQNGESYQDFLETHDPYAADKAAAAKDAAQAQALR